MTRNTNFDFLPIMQRGERWILVQSRQTHVTHIHTLLWQKQVSGGVLRIFDKHAVKYPLLLNDSRFDSLCGIRSGIIKTIFSKLAIFIQNSSQRSQRWLNIQQQRPTGIHIRLGSEWKQNETFSTEHFSLYCCGRVNFLRNQMLPHIEVGSINEIKWMGNSGQTERRQCNHKTTSAHVLS